MHIHEAQAKGMSRAMAERRKLDKWHTVLLARGFVGNPHRAEALCHFLVSNEFDTMEHLKEAPPLSTWEGVSNMNQGMYLSLQ